MLTMDQQHDIRICFYEKGESISQIAEKFKMDWKTVRKYIDQVDFNPPVSAPASAHRFCPKLDPYKPTIDAWLCEDKNAPRKQRHTAKRVFKRLTKECEGFTCSYRLVASYVAQKKQELFQPSKEGFLPLVHRPGEAQADFGVAMFYENGTAWEGKYLALSFPYSNQGYVQLFYGENMECLLEGLDAIFRHIGYVPEEIWFDNASTMVSGILKGGGRKLTERFTRFQEHYGFKAVFMNPDAGHEKGNVENKVGYSRRNLMVPVPRFLSIADYNLQLLKDCDDDAKRDHYRFQETIAERFLEDLKHCRSLPEIPFRLEGEATATTNGWGKFYLYKGKHEYSVSPKHANRVVNLRLTSSHVTVLDQDFREIVTHRRLYGDGKQQSMEWVPYLRHIAIRPRALKNSGIYDMMPCRLKDYLQDCTNSEVGKVLKVLADLTERTGFESALHTVEQAVLYQAKDADSLQNLYRRLYADVPLLPPMTPKPGIPKIEQMPANLLAYDEVLKKGGVCHG